MKKVLIPILLGFLLGGCQHHNKGGGTGTGVTTTITPSQLLPTTPPTAGPIMVTSRQPANEILITALFAGSNLTQSVAVTTSKGGDTIASFSNSPTGNKSPILLSGPGDSVVYSIFATVGKRPYTQITNVPNVIGEPDIAGVYSDGLGDTVTVFVTDLGTPSKP